jgi:DNA-binding transcriptional MerR regulator
MRVGEVAARAGVNVETLRYYERRGLLPEPERMPSGSSTSVDPYCS